jgi:hypothetical protein
MDNNDQIERRLADAATTIYNLGIATTDKPAHERFDLILRVMRCTVGEALTDQRDRMLKHSDN